MFVRWDNLKIQTDEGAAPGAPGGPGREQPLPGYGDPAVVRRFDAPEALDMRFYEVRAKSVLNKVPEQSRMPFRWTVNPYRGCSHACTYCLAPSTPVLLADGTERAIGELREGDAVYGTARERGERWLERTTVLATWRVRKAAWEVELADGTTLVASGDHRLLTVRGWRHVEVLRAGDRLVGLPAGVRERRPALVGAPGREDGEAGAGATQPGGLAGHAVGAEAELVVVGARALDEELELVDVTTGTGDFVAAGVVSHNCFARPTHTYLDMDAGRDFEREIVVKVNAPEVLAAQLRKPRWAREHVAMGTNTDPYQWVESKYRLMPGIWAALRDTRTPCSVLTKSPLLLRDVDVMLEVAAVTELHANLSVPTIDRDAWRASEPHTPHPKARLEAVAELNRVGIPTGILVAPLMPGINDDPRQVEAILQAAADAGAKGVSGIGLHLRGEVRGVFMDWLRSYRPDLVDHYEDLYARGAYLPVEERRRLTGMLCRAPEGAPWIGAGRIPGFSRDGEVDGPPRADDDAAVTRASERGRPVPGGPGGLRGIGPDEAARRRARDRASGRGGALRPVELQTALF